MMKKLMSLGLVGIMSASLLVGCSSNNDSKDDDTVTIKYVDENGNVVKKDHVTRREAKEIERKQQSNDTTKKEQTTKEQPSKQHKDTTTKDDHNYDDELYGNAARGTCPDCGRTAMVFNNGAGLKCAYCGFYDDGYFLDEEPDPSYSDNKEDDYTPEDNSEDDYNYDEQEEQDDDYNDYEDEEPIENNNDVEESPSETIENN